ncbi:MAG: TorF family putative porin [Moraxellaceae bacterium]|nr:TorF family putative porin [Moraxellaceae bacterium]
MKLTKLSAAVLTAGMMLGTAAHADDAALTVSGDVSITSDYLYRGFTQTSSSPALQGTLSIAHSSGLYFTLWGSSISGESVPAQGLELDPSIGFAGTAGDIEYDVGVLYYGYPGSSAPEAAAGAGQSDFVEFYGSISMMGASFGAAYSPDFYGEAGDSLYLSASYGADVGGFGLSAAVGFSTGDAYADDIIDYKVAVSKEVIGLGLELAYIGTDVSGVDEAVVFTVSKGF